MLDRRQLFKGGFATLVFACCIKPAQSATNIAKTRMRGSLDASSFGLRPGAMDDQSKVFQGLINEAARRELPVFLPPGTYPVSNLTLPKTLRLEGVRGASRLVYTGNGHLFAGDDCELFTLKGLTIDGQNRWLSDQTQALIDLRRIAKVHIDDCEIIGAGKSVLSLEKCGGRIERSRLAGGQDYALYAVESEGLTVTGNEVEDCGNGGILIHRWQKGPDSSMVTHNRISRIGARRGGTGQYGNGINLFRADGVTIANNTVSDCAFSAIRANSSSNMIAQGNSCQRSGETALYAEFNFEGAVIANNIIDGAANGISVVNFNEGGRMAVVQGNIVRNLHTTGPYRADAPGFGVGISVEADTAVTGNMVEAAPLYGLHLGWGGFLRSVAATGNVIRDCGTGIAVSVSEGASQTLISDNVIDRSRHGAIIGYDHAKAATPDLARTGAAGFRHLVIERNAVS